MSQHDEARTAPGRGVVRVATIVTAIALAMFGATTAAEAATACPDWICLFDVDGRPIGGYGNITEDFQDFERFRTASAFNGFGNQAVYFHYRSGMTSCVLPERFADLVFTDKDPVDGLDDPPRRHLLPGRRDPVVATSEGAPGQGTSTSFPRTWPPRLTGVRLARRGRTGTSGS